MWTVIQCTRPSHPVPPPSVDSHPVHSPHSSDATSLGVCRLGWKWAVPPACHPAGLCGRQLIQLMVAKSHNCDFILNMLTLILKCRLSSRTFNFILNILESEILTLISKLFFLVVTQFFSRRKKILYPRQKYQPNPNPNPNISLTQP